MAQYFIRQIDKYLNEWKDDRYRKPLLIRGARQIGKSSAARNFGKTFKYFVEINLEREQDLKELFGKNIDVKKICSRLSVLKQIPIVPGETLLFIDEIQESERAIASLRYFYEDYPELHVVAAGSLLEFALRELSSFGVGRITSVYMYPFSFDEFLRATGQGMLADYKMNEASCTNPLPQSFHDNLVDSLRAYYLIGGMPEAVRYWQETHDMLHVSRIHNNIINTYQDDFSKYKSRISPLLLRNTLLSVAKQAGGKFVYSQVENGTNTGKVKEALQLLALAGIVIPVTHTAANGIPLGAEVNTKFQKYLLADIGLMQAMLKLSASDLLLSSDVDFVNKGGMAEVFTGLELIKYSSPFVPPEQFYWQRLEKGTQSEIDYIIEQNQQIIPVEVKAGTRGSMQSLRIFMNLKHSTFGIRTCLENFGCYDNIKVYPLYAISSFSSEAE